MFRLYAEHLRDAALRRRDGSDAAPRRRRCSPPRGRSRRGEDVFFQRTGGIRTLLRVVGVGVGGGGIRCRVAVVYGSERVCVLTLQMSAVLRQFRAPAFLFFWWWGKKKKSLAFQFCNLE